MGCYVLNGKAYIILNGTAYAILNIAAYVVLNGTTYVVLDVAAYFSIFQMGCIGPVYDEPHFPTAGTHDPAQGVRHHSKAPHWKHACIFKSP